MPRAMEKVTSATAAAVWRETRRKNRRPVISSSVRVSYMAEAASRMIVGHPDRLHVGIADGRADELEAALEQVLAERVRFRGADGNLVSLQHDRLAADEAPDIGVEAAEFLLYREKGARVGHGAIDLQLVADDAGVLHQFPFFSGVEARNLARIKTRE